MSSSQLEPALIRHSSTSLLTLAATGLEQMLDPERSLFCFTARLGSNGLVRKGFSPRYTMMSLLGLDRWHRSGQAASVPTAGILDRLIADTTWLNCLGDLGLLLWTCSALAPGRLAEVTEKTQARDAHGRYQDGVQGRSMELAWFLTGLCYSLRSGVPGLTDFHAVSEHVFRLLVANQGKKGVFGHLARSESLTGFLRGHIGSFADQVYPIYALAKYYELTGNREALARAMACAENICEQQGPLGEWWWHYNASTGRVFETYPVYSVHQHAMAPMALFALARANRSDFTLPIEKGLSWIYGNNDLQVDMRSEIAPIVWRNFFLPPTMRYWHKVTALSAGVSKVPKEKLRVNYECRPYELGWMLYAWAGG